MESNLRTNYSSSEYNNNTRNLKKDEMLESNNSDFTKVKIEIESPSTNENNDKSNVKNFTRSVISNNSNKFVPVIVNTNSNINSLNYDSNKNLQSNNLSNNRLTYSKGSKDYNNDKPKKFILKLYCLINVRIL